MPGIGRTLWLWDTLPQKGLKSEEQTWLKEGDAVENVHRLNLANHTKSSFERICSGVRPPHTVQHTLDLLATLVELAKPGAEFIINEVVLDDAGSASPPNTRLNTISTIHKNLKLAGLIKIETASETAVTEDTTKDIQEKFSLSENELFKVVHIKCQTPDFESGSSQLLSFAKKIQDKKQETSKNISNNSTNASAAEKNAIWSLDSLDDEEVDLIDPDTLIDEEDLKKPEAASLRVCGTTGKRKACKDCSCGLAEELSDGKAVTKKSVNSSCGSCYLGDAFRCASCPYLGMPAFKPGEKIQLSERQLKADA